MNVVQVHLALNHLPVIGILFGLAALFMAKAKGSNDLYRFALYVFAFTALVTLPVFFTGEPVEELIEHMAGVSEDVIEAHEEAALFALIAAAVAGLLSFGGLIRMRKGLRWPAWADKALLITAIVGGLLMARTAHLGGLIRHSELTSRTAGP